jgi:hypothetical protein
VSRAGAGALLLAIQGVLLAFGAGGPHLHVGAPVAAVSVLGAWRYAAICAGLVIPVWLAALLARRRLELVEDPRAFALAALLCGVGTGFFSGMFTFAAYLHRTVGTSTANELSFAAVVFVSETAALPLALGTIALSARRLRDALAALLVLTIGYAVSFSLGSALVAPGSNVDGPDPSYVVLLGGPLLALGVAAARAKRSPRPARET